MIAFMDILLVVILIVSGSVWIGGYSAVIIVSLISSRALDPDARIRFFRMLGGAYLKVMVPALLLTYMTGWLVLAQRPWSVGVTWLAVGSGLLLLVLLAGVMQARDMTRLRRRASAEPENAMLALTIRRRARSAAILRGLIGVLTLGIVVNVALLLTTPL